MKTENTKSASWKKNMDARVCRVADVITYGGAFLFIGLSGELIARVLGTSIFC